MTSARSVAGFVNNTIAMQIVTADRTAIVALRIRDEIAVLSQTCPTSCSLGSSALWERKRGKGCSGVELDIGMPPPMFLSITTLLSRSKKRRNLGFTAAGEPPDYSGADI